MPSKKEVSTPAWQPRMMADTPAADWNPWRTVKGAIAANAGSRAGSDVPM